MAIKPYIDETGIHIPEYHEILDDLKSKWREIFGADLYLEADSQEGEMLQIFALGLYDAYQFSSAAYQGFSPQTAQGMGLSRMVKLNGLRRRGATKSYADVRVVGVAGTEIIGGIVEDIAGQRWNLPPSVTIPYEGEILVTATAQEAGAIRAQPGEISKIATPTRGWQTVENPEAAIAGVAVESDAELRLRQTHSTALPSLSVFEGIVGAVWNIDGVSRMRGYENDTNVTDANGIPPHSISLVVDGGDAQEITEAIRAKKTPGTGTYGAITIPITDRYGLVTRISFFRPAVVDVKIMIRLKIKSGYSADIEDKVKSNLVAYVNSLGIGNSVLLSKLYLPIDLADTNAASNFAAPGEPRFEVLELQMMRNPPYLPVNLNIAFNEVALLEAGDIDIVTTL
ncbi:MAG: baseplate J/gp47 family protein [Synergistaceae bacterium]|jgi:uncharacterized phage protein gp47/JayE|nr:baseplate J/gp47 family protein [Synergistaceae bacterium]